jgi:hypothetical protein
MRPNCTAYYGGEVWKSESEVSNSFAAAREKQQIDVQIVIVTWTWKSKIQCKNLTSESKLFREKPDHKKINKASYYA